MRASKAQVTSFIVVGLVLLGVVGILFSVTDGLKNNSVTRTQLDDDRYRYDAAVKVIRDCIMTSSEQSILLVASQGGALYDSQDGWGTTDQGIPITLQGSQTTFVAAGILRRNDEPQTSFDSYQAPGRLRTTPLDPLSNQAIKKLGGQVVVPKLCDRYGPNDPTNANVSLTCELSSYGYDGHTIQNELSQSIRKKTQECVAQSDVVLSEIADVKSYFANLPQVILGDDSVTVSYSFVTNVTVSKSNFSYFQSTVTVPVRLKRLYNFVEAVLDRDSKDILFDKSVAYPSVTGCNYPGTSLCWTDGFNVEIRYRAFTDIVTGYTYDLLIARDARSVILGQQLTFSTIIENRRPVLVPVPLICAVPLQNGRCPMANSLSFPQTYDSRLADDWYLRYDKYSKYTDRIFFKPVAYDYDEDVISYNYSGWKATGDVTYNTGKAGAASSSSNGGCDTFNADGSPAQCKYWDESYFFDDREAAGNEWQSSNAYSNGASCDGDTKRCAEFQPASDGSDLGPHTVLITATDRGGLTDTQGAAVLVGTD